MHIFHHHAFCSLKPSPPSLHFSASFLTLMFLLKNVKHPESLPKAEVVHLWLVDASSDFSLFEALRETIYSEVATLISQNESRPHFLIELFHELQLLNTDYLRQRALYSLQVTVFLSSSLFEPWKRPFIWIAAIETMDGHKKPKTVRDCNRVFLS